MNLALSRCTHNFELAIAVEITGGDVPDVAEVGSLPEAFALGRENVQACRAVIADDRFVYPVAVEVGGPDVVDALASAFLPEFRSVRLKAVTALPQGRNASKPSSPPTCRATRVTFACASAAAWESPVVLPLASITSQRPWDSDRIDRPARGSVATLAYGPVTLQTRSRPSFFGLGGFRPFGSLLS